MEEPLAMKTRAETVMLKALLDSGAGASLILAKYCSTLKTATKNASLNTVAEIIKWDDASIPMKTTSAQVSNSFRIKDPEGIDNMVGCISEDMYKTILQAKYEKANLTKDVEENCTQ
eukprot:14247633-Ditylum_brightwellii.AAC.1